MQLIRFDCCVRSLGFVATLWMCSLTSAQPMAAAAPSLVPTMERQTQQASSSPSSSTALSVRAASDVGTYADTDHVYVITPSLSGTISSPIEGWSVGGSYLVDVISAASVDIVATASQNWHEVRHAGTLHGAYKPGPLGVAANASLSVEPDYVSWSAGASATQDLLDQNVTLLLGLNHSHDVAGRGDTPFSVFSRTVDRENIKAGITLVLDPATLATFTLDTGIEHGDQSKPYRYIPLFAPGTDVANGAPIAVVNRLRVSERPLEQLPLTRDRFAVSGAIFHRFDGSTLRVDERVYADTWLLVASSTDARWLFDWGKSFELGPHVRAHAQNGVKFWERAYVLRPAFNVPALRTGDRELGPLIAGTLGLTMVLRLGSSAARDRWRLGLDINITQTSYLDDLYLTHRLSAYSALYLEAQL
jgi:Protein of unknown function (DUF3570)